MAIVKEWMRKNPFYGYKLEQDEAEPVFLTSNELQAIMNKNFDIPRLELVKDIFCLRASPVWLSLMYPH
jgi:hypothetical protein